MRWVAARFVLIALLVVPLRVLAEARSDNDLNRLQSELVEMQNELKEVRELLRTQQLKIRSLEAQGNHRTATETKSQYSGAVSAGNFSSGKIPEVGGTGTKAGGTIVPVGRLMSIPDIGLVGDIVGTSSKTLDNDEGNNRISLRELELVLGSDLDPYARFDSTITFSDSEDPDVEEAYVSYWGLPGEVKGRIGRMHPKIGKASATHRDVLDTVDEPLVIQEYLGLEGLFKSGLDFSGFLPFATDSYTPQWSLGMFEGGVGDGGALLADRPSRPSGYAHISNFFDINDTSNFELGGTYLVGPGATRSYSAVHTLALDCTYLSHITPLNKLKLQSELFAVRRNELAGYDDQGQVQSFDSNPFGWYALVDYRASARWGIGTRYDWVKPIVLNSESPRSADQALSAYLTFYQSEFARWRLQYERARLVSGQDDNRVFLQGTFAIGTHKHAIN